MARFRHGRAPNLLLGTNGHHIVDGYGRPFMLRGEAAWCAIAKLDRAAGRAYLDNCNARRINTVLVSLVEVGAYSGPANAYGDVPFTGLTTSGGIVNAANFDNVNAAYFARAREFIQDAAERGIVVELCPLYFGLGNEGWIDLADSNGATKVEDYGQYVGETLGDLDNIVWINGGDNYPGNLTIANALAAGLQAGETVTHLMTTHWSRHESGTLGSPSWLTLNSTYTGQDTHNEALTDYAASPTLATHLVEAYYEGTLGGQPNLSALEIRQQAWGAMLSGCSGFINGHHDIWRFVSGYASAFSAAGRVSVSHLWNLLHAMNWSGLAPATGSSLVTSGRGTLGTNSYVTASKNARGTDALIYIPGGGAIDVDLSVFAGPVAFTWIDPTSGARSSAGSFSASGTQTFDPSNNAAGATDMALLAAA